MDDANYEKNGQKVIDELMKDLQGKYNTIRIYNVNPDLSYGLFMARMSELGVYVLVGASPANNPYFGQYRYSTVRKDLGPAGTIKRASDGSRVLDQTESCYPALLLEYGKKIAKMFAQYDNTLGLIVANEIMQETLTAAACVKQYVSDLKNWMRVNGRKMRLLPVAFAIADSAYKGGSPDSDVYGVLKLQGLLCGDTMKNGLMYQSIDLFLINSYRWCPNSDFRSAYARLVAWTAGIPIVVALGEFGCKNSGNDTRDFAMVPYLMGTAKGSSSDNVVAAIFSGGTAYSYGEAQQSANSNFPLFTGGDIEMDGRPSFVETPDFANLVRVYAENPEPREVGGWTQGAKDRCTWVPTLETKPKQEWILRDCAKVRVVDDSTSWLTSSRNGAVCSASGSPCDVSVSARVGTSEIDLCGYVDVVSGGGTCETDEDCGLKGMCRAGACVCVTCYTGPQCNARDVVKCAELSSLDGAPVVILGITGLFLATMMIILMSLYFQSRKMFKAKRS